MLDRTGAYLKNILRNFQPLRLVKICENLKLISILTIYTIYIVYTVWVFFFSKNVTIIFVCRNTIYVCFVEQLLTPTN